MDVWERESTKWKVSEKVRKEIEEFLPKIEKEIGDETLRKEVTLLKFLLINNEKL